ncbi:hypothetical protein BGZ76_001085 [Entomortierella beljakovae]|nr:hypothetical protein BGZ76_001085 [Entomortierella beljakovae]
MYMKSALQLQYWKTFFTPERFSHDQIPDLAGKVAIVTGANTGLGYAIAVSLAANGAHVFFACRSKERALDAIEKARAEIKKNYPNASDPKMEFLELDLCDIKKTHKAAKDFLARNLPLHILVCNAALFAAPYELSVDGIEVQFAVNHIGHFVFTTTLLDRIKESQPSRIVMVASDIHEINEITDFTLEAVNKPVGPFTPYAQSKAANILFANALARRLENDQVWVNSLYPGIVYTEIARHTGKIFGERFMNVMLKTSTYTVAMTPAHASLTPLYLATSPEVVEKNIRGRYFIPIANELQPVKRANQANNLLSKSILALETKDKDIQENLWNFSERIVLEKLGEKTIRMP